MNALPELLAAGVGLLALGMAQWLALRALHRRKLDALRDRHLRQQLSLSNKLAQAHRQIGVLQQEMAAARAALRQRRDRMAAAAEAAPGGGTTH